MNPPENRENLAEIFFETFSVPGLYIGVQPVLACIGCCSAFQRVPEYMDVLSKEQQQTINELTGVVVDSGESVTHIVPICSGYLLELNIKHIPIAGKEITKFMEQMIRDKAVVISDEDLYFAATRLKEFRGYVAENDLLEEFAKFDKKMKHNRTGTFHAVKLLQNVQRNWKHIRKAI